MLELLAVAEDYRGGLRLLLDQVRSAGARVAAGGDGAVEFDALVLQAEYQFYLKDHLHDELVMELERRHWSERRLQGNTAARERRRLGKQENEDERESSESGTGESSGPTSD